MTTLVAKNTIIIKATINKELNLVVAIPYDSTYEGDVNVLLVSSKRQTQSKACKLQSLVISKVSTIAIVSASKVVNFELLVGAPIPSLSKPLVDRAHYLLILDVNGLLCDAVHIKATKGWKPLVNLVKCGNKLVSPWPNLFQFLQLCVLIVGYGHHQPNPIWSPWLSSC